jgi:hypothetical protein
MIQPDSVFYALPRTAIPKAMTDQLRGYGGNSVRYFQHGPDIVSRAAVFCAAAVPSVRRMPFMVFATTA